MDALEVWHMIIIFDSVYVNLRSSNFKTYFLLEVPFTVFQLQQLAST